ITSRNPVEYLSVYNDCASFSGSDGKTDTDAAASGRPGIMLCKLCAIDIIFHFARDNKLFFHAFLDFSSCIIRNQWRCIKNLSLLTRSEERRVGKECRYRR